MPNSRQFSIICRICPAAAGFNAAAWRARAIAAIAETAESGRRPILVGGSGLYLRALIDGMSPIPRVPPAIRAEAMAELRRLGAPGLHRRLAEVDPQMAGRLAPGDSQRLVRAWEVKAATGQSLQQWQRLSPLLPPPALRFRGVVLMPQRDVLYRACDQRMAAMVEGGAVGEVARLLAYELDPALPAMKALGIAAFAGYLAGRSDLETATAAAATATRQFAKRQVTWFRHQSPGVAQGIADWRPVPEQYSERLADEIVMMLRRNG